MMMKRRQYAAPLSTVADRLPEIAIQPASSSNVNAKGKPYRLLLSPNKKTCMIIASMLLITTIVVFILQTNIGDTNGFSGQHDSPSLVRRKECNFSKKSPLDHVIVATPDSPPQSTTTTRTARNSKKQEPTILCLLMTHSNADKQIRAVWDTWGPKCDKLLLASNSTTTGGLPSIQTTTPSTYWNLWPKLNETLHYVLQHGDDNNGDNTPYYYQQYDWIYKIDDDSFVIMENLKQFLMTYHASSELMSKPLVFGYMLQDSKWSDFKQYFDWSPENQKFGDYFFHQLRSWNQPTEYLAGGAGYVMNRQYFLKLIKALDDDSSYGNSTIYGHVPEDMAHGVTMLAHGIQPQNSKDTLGRERFVPEPPELWEIRTAKKYAQSKGSRSKSCISNYAISFHHMQPDEMRNIYHQLYRCRTNI